MTRLNWDTPGERFYETGVDRGVLYVDSVGYAWNGLISVQEKSPGGNSQPLYLDGYKYAQLESVTEFEATLNAYSSPREFGPCDGSFELYNGFIVTQQKRKQFGLSYRTKVGDDLEGEDLGYKIHVVYNALTTPSDRNNQTITDSITPMTLSWGITTNPPSLTGIRPTSHFIVDTRRADPATVSSLEDILYGLNAVDPRLPTASELVAMFA